jgi:hypothetical protein
VEGHHTKTTLALLREVTLLGDPHSKENKMLKVYGNKRVSGTAQDLDLVSTLVRARLYRVLGPEQGELHFKGLPAFPLLLQVAREIGALQAQ